MTSPHYTLLLAQQNTKEPFFCIDFKKFFGLSKKLQFFAQSKSFRYE